MIIVPGQAVGLIGDGGNNEVATFTDDRHIQGEANLTFDGSTLTVTGALTVGVDDTGHDVKFFGATASRYMLWDESEDYLIFPDNVKAVFGTGGDLSIYHDSNHSYISDQGTGNIAILANDFQVNNAANNANMISATQGGAVALNHNGSTKLATHASGVEITGSLEVATIDFTDGDLAMTINDTGTVTFAQAVTADAGVTVGDTAITDGKIADSGDFVIEAGGNNIELKGTGSAATYIDIDTVSGQNARLTFQNGGTIKWNIGNQASNGNLTFYNDQTDTTAFYIEADNDAYFSDDVRMGANLDMEGYSVFGNGSGLDPSYTLTVDRAFSDTSQAVSLRVRGTITSTDGTGTLAGFQVQPAGTVINSGNAHNVYSAWFIEPAITETSGSVTTAATVYIQNAPTEAASNYALFVDAGDSRFDGNVGIGAAPSHELDIQGDTPTFQLTSTNAIADTSSTETIADIDWEGQKNSLYRTVARIRGRANGTWSSATAGDADSAFDFYVNNGTALVLKMTLDATALTLGADGSGINQQWYGDISGRDMLWDADANRLEFKDNTYMSFGTGADTQMYHTGSGMKMDTDDLTIQSSTSTKPVLAIKNTTGGSGTGAILDLYRSTTSEQDDDYIGNIEMNYDNDAAQKTKYLHIYSQAKDVTDGTEDGNIVVRAMVNGTLTTLFYSAAAVVSGDFNDTSDVMLKDNIEDIDTAIDTVKQLRPVTFDWKVDDREASGFIAQEVEKIIPNIVTGIDATEDGDRTEHKSIKTIGLVAQITKALQESIEKIETLEAQVKELQEA